MACELVSLFTLNNIPCLDEPGCLSVHPLKRVFLALNLGNYDYSCYTRLGAGFCVDLSFPFNFRMMQIRYLLQKMKFNFKKFYLTFSPNVYLCHDFCPCPDSRAN